MASPIDQENKRKEIDKRTITLISAAVPPENTVTVTSGGKP